MSANAFPYVIVSGYKTGRQCFYCRKKIWGRVFPAGWRTDFALSAHYRTLEIAIAETHCIRRKRLAIVKNFGTKHERVVWERSR